MSPLLSLHSSSVKVMLVVIFWVSGIKNCLFKLFQGYLRMG